LMSKPDRGSRVPVLTADVRRRTKMSRIRNLRPGVLLPAALLALLSGCTPYNTGPTEVGVRTIKFGFLHRSGVEQKAYEPGATYWFIPIINEWHTFDTRIQVMEMTIHPEKGDRGGRDDLLFKTIDGNDISLDVIISYRIDPRKAPHILEFVAQSDDELRENLVRTVARSSPRDIFGELRSEELYVSEERAKKATRAKEILNLILNPFGIIVENVLTKDYRYNPPYQKAIEDRKIADQLAEKAKSEARAAEEEWRQKLQEAIGTVNQVVARADGEYLQAKIDADAYFDQQDKIAKAVKAEAEAEAKGLREMTQALVGRGGETMVKLKVAEALQGRPILLLPMSGGSLDVKTTDVNRLLELYGIQRLAPQVGPGAPPAQPKEGKPAP
jgi:regulator of protease activity HflC (stomatin/prohibitin superfamily)